MTDLGEGGGITVQLDGPYGGGGSIGKISELVLPAESWKGVESPFSMTITSDCVSMRSKVDLWPTAALMEELTVIGTGLCAVNDNGIVTVYAFGNKPQSDITIQATFTEVGAE